MKKPANQQSKTASADQSKPANPPSMEELLAIEPKNTSASGGQSVGAQPISVPPTKSIKRGNDDDGIPSNEIFIPIHEYAWLTNNEMSIVDHPAFQRLRNVLQLGLAHLVFPSATHQRFEHSLGTVQMAQMIIDALAHNRKRMIRKLPEIEDSLPPILSPKEITLIRLSALLHDIGHIPAGHTLENELKLLPKHTTMKRLDLVLDREIWFGIKTQKLRKLINTTYEKVFTTTTPCDLLCAVISENPIITEKVVDGIRLTICRDIVGNTICADFLDYIHRDCFHLGRPRYFEKRIFQYMELAKDKHTDQDTFMISLGTSDRLRTDAITAIASLLDSRYQLSEIILFHRAKCKAASMLERALQELLEYKSKASSPKESKEKLELWKNRIQEDLLDESDCNHLRFFQTQAEGCEAALRPLRKLLHRHLYQEIAVFPYRDIVPETLVTKLRNQYCENEDSPQLRLNVLRELEADFHLPIGSLAMYCPSVEMNAKIPGVKILLDDSVETYAKWDSDYQNLLDGGHIHAQLERFKRLWRLQVTLDCDVYDSWSAELRAEFHRSVKCLILRIAENPHSPPEKTIVQIAKQLTLIEGSPYYNRKCIPVEEIAARWKTAKSAYLDNMPTLRSLYLDEV